MAYIPGAGRKKPLNMLENPIQPDITQALPEFKWSGKHWKVDAGATMRNTEDMDIFHSSAVLAQSRDYNQTIYGKSSHRDIVNAEFRPPILDPYEDMYSLNRVPVTTRRIVPRINPEGVSDGTASHRADNRTENGVFSALTDRVVSGEMRPTYFKPLQMNDGPKVLPDLETVIPSVSASAGFLYPTINGRTEYEDIDLGEGSINSRLQPGMNIPLQLNGENGRENMTLFDNRPSVSVSAGATSSDIAPLRIEEIELLENRPFVSVTAGGNSRDITSIQNIEMELQNSRPSVSVSSGMSPNIQIDGKSAHVEIGDLKSAPTSIITTNPGTTLGGVWLMEKPTEEYITSGRPSYSYTVPKEVGYRSRVLNAPRRMREKLAPIQPRNQISTAGAIPSFGISIQPVSLKTKQNVFKGKGYRF